MTHVNVLENLKEIVDSLSNQIKAAFKESSSNINSKRK